MIVFLFDIDGTLLNTGGAGRAALEGAMAVGFGVERMHDVPISGRTDRGIARNLFQVHQIADSGENWQRFRDEYLRQLPGQLVARSGRVLPGVCELLDRLAGRTDVWLGLLTGNTRDGARLKLDYFGLSHFFHGGGFGDEHCDRDSVARAALADVRQRLNGQRTIERVWVVGDTPLDVQCARAIGARAAAVATGSHARSELAAAAPDLLFDDLSMPHGLLDGLV